MTKGLIEVLKFKVGKYTNNEGIACAQKVKRIIKYLL